MSQRSQLIAVVAVCALSSSSLADNGSPFFGNRFESGTLAIQQKVETLYQQGDYERALFIYENELAPVGDKYAQYMVGFMHLTGTGVPEDAVAASAWYRLAAERSYPEFVAVRDQLLESFTEPDLLRSDYEYRELRRKYSDLVLIGRVIEEDLELLRPEVGSRAPHPSQPVTIIDPNSGIMVSADFLRGRARSRIEERLEQIDSLIEADVETDVDRLDLDVLKEQIRTEIERIDDR